ncbi:MAG: NAD(P)H-dependent oxidoreductase [Endomicrobiaceae bacterium]|jgi:FMN-dependent NADH-azoreductase|nr:NAD(P)H-dependent oxidoreductase [Endomicrobiaceae bacterium]MDD3730428.1 NAD(P)H-dependent oxidoreductase [Endomicrobiaceae bacterium]MDD4166325.1 NAD(P)H-dependent oxidoreductase [Endomicrobiaceae bacterium]
MKTILYVKANPKPNELSRTFQISEKFIESYSKKNPQDKIITLDLYKENINFLTIESIQQIFGPKDESSKNNPLLSYAYTFAKADKYVIAAPLWNLGVPSILKAYFDYITVKDISFKYTAEGPVGLLKNKSALYVSARGGKYDTEPMSNFEFGERYIKTILNFLGVVNYSAIFADGVDIMGADIKQIINTAVEKAAKLAEIF